jgi:hypothetical protein
MSQAAGFSPKRSGRVLARITLIRGRGDGTGGTVAARVVGRVGFKLANVNAGSNE